MRRRPLPFRMNRRRFTRFLTRRRGHGWLRGDEWSRRPFPALLRSLSQGIRAEIQLASAHGKQSTGSGVMWLGQVGGESETSRRGFSRLKIKPVRWRYVQQLAGDPLSLQVARTANEHPTRRRNPRRTTKEHHASMVADPVHRRLPVQQQIESPCRHSRK